jgi:NAD(P)-dependent dehydrogenase (short-subunit alcohol dehydrogenase family)
MPTAVITGASRGLGLALSRALAERDWNLIIDARDGAAMERVVDDLDAGHRVTAIAGDVSNPRHRDELAVAVSTAGELDLLVNNASTLGPSPLPGLAEYPLEELERVLRINTIAPLALTQQLLPHLQRAGGTIVNLTSDAGAEAYEGWGGYGSSKAALDQVSAVLAVEHPSLHIYAFDPGDMRTEMHQDAYPGEDISDRPEPETVVPSLLRLIVELPPSGRYRAGDLPALESSNS